MSTSGSHAVGSSLCVQCNAPTTAGTLLCDNCDPEVQKQRRAEKAIEAEAQVVYKRGNRNLGTRITLITLIITLVSVFGFYLQARYTADQREVGLKLLADVQASNKKIAEEMRIREEAERSAAQNREILQQQQNVEISRNNSKYGNASRNSPTAGYQPSQSQQPQFGTPSETLEEKRAGEQIDLCFGDAAQRYSLFLDRKSFTEMYGTNVVLKDYNQIAQDYSQMNNLLPYCSASSRSILTSSTRDVRGYLVDMINYSYEHKYPFVLQIPGG